MAALSPSGSALQITFTAAGKPPVLVIDAPRSLKIFRMCGRSQPINATSEAAAYMPTAPGSEGHIHRPAPTSAALRMPLIISPRPAVRMSSSRWNRP